MTERAGGLKCGAASVEITPAKLIGMAGYSRAGKIAKGASGRLFARSLLFDDGAGRRLAFCFIDLMSASRYLLAAATRRTGGLLNSEQLLLAGTHTHTGPGRFYGNPFYDHFAQVDSGFDRDLADTLAAGIAASLMRAAEHAVPARVGFATTELWGYSRNRSLIPFLENTASAEWAAIHPPPPNLPADFQAIDPRVRVVSAVRADTSALIGSFATFSCHATALGEGHDMYDPDWPGVAVEIAAHAFPPDAVVAIAAGTAADMSPTRDSPQQSPELARLVGEQVGAAVVKATNAAMTSAAEVSLSTAFMEFEPAKDRIVNGRPDTELATRWAIGAPTLGGAFDGRSDLYRLHLVRDGMAGQDFPSTDPQFPKTLALGEVQRILIDLLRLDQARTLPLQAFRLGSHLFVTIPGEPTISFGHAVEVALKKLSGVSDVHVMGYAGDYAGYCTTHEEYMLQHYEGASMIYGRFWTRHLLARLALLVAHL